MAQSGGTAAFVPAHQEPAARCRNTQLGSLFHLLRYRLLDRSHQPISGENNPLAATPENDYQRWRAEFEAIRQRYSIPEGTPAIERSLMEAFSRAQNSLLSDGLDQVIKEANQGNQARAQEILAARIPVLIADVRKTANALQEHLSTIGADVMRDGQHQFQTMLYPTRRKTSSKRSVAQRH